MKNLNRKLSMLIIAVITLMAMMGTAFAADNEIIADGKFGADITWTLSDTGTLTFSGTGETYNSGGPSYRPWSKYVDQISTVIFDDRITSIGNGILAGCKNLESAILPNNLVRIGYGAFQECSNLKIDQLPDGVTSIGANAFYMCSRLALTKLPSGLTEIKSGTFNWCFDLSLTSLPDGITAIEDNAFENCSKLALTKLPEGLSEIGGNAFKGCVKISLTELPESCRHIGDKAFNGCTELALVELPKDVKVDCYNPTITQNHTFYGCRWRAKTEHYVESLDGSYTLEKVTYMTVAAGSTYNAKYEDFSARHLHIARNENDHLTETVRNGVSMYGIPAGKAIVFQCYYDLDRITVTINDDKGGSTNQEIPYGGKATEPELEERPGYKLVWVTEDGEHFDFDTPITEPITISPVWAPVGGIHGVVVDSEGKPVPDAHIAVVAGNTDYFETDADANGHFWIYDVPYGSYDMVTTKRALTVTSLFELDAKLEEVTVTLPDAQTNSVLTVNQGTKDVVVGGLDELFNSEIYDATDRATVAGGGSVTVKMTVKAVTEEEIPDTAAELKAAAQADGKTIFGYMTMDVAKITETAAGDVTEANIPELPQLLQIIDPLSEEQKGKTGYAVYRMHEGHVYTITETPNENGAYIEVTDDTLTIFASKFSDYCLGFDTPKKPTEQKPTPSPVPSDSSDDDDDDGGRRNPFIDVKPNDWFYNDVLDAYYAGYMEGITSNTFEPDAPLTRAQAAYTFAKVAKAQLKGLEITGNFEDVTRATAYAEAITWANDAGVEIGYGNGCFGPTDSLTREQLALMLYRTYGNGQIIQEWEGDFEDVADVSDWSEVAVHWAVHVGLLEGNDRGELLPQGGVTRAEAAALILRAVELPQQNRR